MIWCIEECDDVMWCVDVISVDVLCDVVCFVCGNFCVVDVVE